MLLDIIEKDPILAAPFYHYETSCFFDKRAQIEHFNRSLDRKLGRYVLQELFSEEVSCHS
jgi:hypothetical protein